MRGRRRRRLIRGRGWMRMVERKEKKTVDKRKRVDEDG